MCVCVCVCARVCAGEMGNGELNISQPQYKLVFNDNWCTSVCVDSATVLNDAMVTTTCTYDIHVHIHLFKDIIHRYCTCTCWHPSHLKNHLFTNDTHTHTWHTPLHNVTFSCMSLFYYTQLYRQIDNNTLSNSHFDW